MLATVLSVISILIVGVNFILSILDRGKKDQKENHQELIEYQIKEIKTDIKEIKDLLRVYKNDVEDKINKAIELHETLYHKGELK